METQTQNNINERLARAYQEVTEKKKKKLDPVDKDELKGSHADREDGDIDNDGDEDESDKFLHKKRKAISKNVKDSQAEDATPVSDNDPRYKDDVNLPANKKKKKPGAEEVVMNPKMTTASKSGEARESTIRSKLISVLENKDKHTKGATPPEMMDDKLKGQGAKDMAKPAQDAIANPALDEPDRIKKDMDKLTANVKVSKKRKGDNPKGDSKVVDPNPIKDPAAMKNESVGSAVRTLKRMVPGHTEKTGKLIQQAMRDQKHSGRFTDKPEYGTDHMRKHQSHAMSNFELAAQAHDHGHHERAHKHAVMAIQHSHWTNAWDDTSPSAHNDLSKHLGMGDNNKGNIEKQNKKVKADMNAAHTRMKRAKDLDQGDDTKVSYKYNKDHKHSSSASWDDDKKRDNW